MVQRTQPPPPPRKSLWKRKWSSSQAFSQSHFLRTLFQRSTCRAKSFKMTPTLDVSAPRFCFDTFCIHHEPFHEIGVGMPCDRLQNENTLSMNILSECLSLHLEESLIHWGGRIRTLEWRYQKPLPYHLATPQPLKNLSRIFLLSFSKECQCYSTPAF